MGLSIVVYIMIQLVKKKMLIHLLKDDYKQAHQKEEDAFLKHGVLYVLFKCVRSFDNVVCKRFLRAATLYRVTA